MTKVNQDNGNVLADHHRETNGFISHTNVYETNDQDKGPPWWRSQRYILAYVLFFGMMNLFCQRINFSIAILCMVNHTAVNGHINHSLDQPYIDRNTNSVESSVSIAQIDQAQGEFNNVSQSYERIQLLSSSVDNTTDLKRNSSETENLCGSGRVNKRQTKEDGPFEWDKETQGLLLGSVYWTYLVIQIPGNILVRNVRKKRTILTSMALMTSCSLLISVAATWSPWAVFCLRLVQGGCTSLAIIAFYGLWAKWAPPNERAGLISLAVSGQMLGNIVVFPVSALLCKYGFQGGWPSVFYVFGAVGILWLVLFYLLTEDTPAHHRYITAAERQYIMTSLKETNTSKHQDKPPWCSIVTSSSCWAVVIAQVTYTWGLFLFLSTLPQYMYEVLNFDIESNGVFSMLPYIALLLTTQIAGQLSDLLKRNSIVPVVWIRKSFILTAFCIPASTLVCLSFLDCGHWHLAVLLLVISVGATGFGLSTIVTNPYDIAPRFASDIMTITNTMGTIPGILTPLIVVTITKNQTREEWQIVLLVTAVIYICGAIGFCILASASLQPWADHVDLELDVSKEETAPMSEQKMTDH